MEPQTTLTINIPPTSKIKAEKDERHRNHGDRSVSYKDKFHKMREKYDKVTSAHEMHQRDLEIANAKIKKLQAENEMLLDAILQGDSALYDKYFPSRPSSPPLPSTSMDLPPGLGSQIPSQSLSHAHSGHPIPTLTSSYQPPAHSSYEPYDEGHSYAHENSSPRRSKRHSHSSSRNYGGLGASNGATNGAGPRSYDFSLESSPPPGAVDMDDPNYGLGGHRGAL